MEGGRKEALKSDAVAHRRGWRREIRSERKGREGRNNGCGKKLIRAEREVVRWQEKGEVELELGD